MIPWLSKRRAPVGGDLDRSPEQIYAGLDQIADLPEQHDGRFTRRLIATIVLGLIVSVIWAAVTPVDEITIGSGVIKTQSNIVRVEHPYGGVIATLDIAAGQHVEAGARLLTIDSTSLERERETLLARKSVLDAEHRRVSFVLSGADRIEQVPASANISPEEQLFWAEQSFLSARLDIIAAEYDAIANRIGTLERRRNSMLREQILLNEQLERLSALVSRGSVRNSDVEATEREVHQIERAVLDLDGSILAERDALKANRLRQTELLAERKRDAAQRQAELTEKMVATEQTLAEINARLDRAVIVASISGTIQALSVSGADEVIGPGDLIAEIVPEGSPVEAEVEIGADKIGTIRPGQEARLKVSTYDFTRFGSIDGVVDAVSPTSFENEDGDTVYRITVKLPNGGENAALSGLPIRPGMVITADILSDQKTVLSYLLKPLREIRSGAFTEK